MTPADLLHVHLAAEGICVGPMFICARIAEKNDVLLYANEPLGATGALPLHLEALLSLQLPHPLHLDWQGQAG